MTTETDALTNQSVFQFDVKNNLTSVTPPSPLGKITLAYDGVSRVTSLTDGKGQTTSFTYDNEDRITQITYNDSSTIGYTINADGDITALADNTGTTSFAYDKDHRLTTKTLPGGTQLALTYDPVGNLTGYTDGASGKSVYAYNSANLLTSLTEPNGNKTTFGYDNDNRRTSTTYPNGDKLAITYDGAGRETGVTSTNSGGTKLASYTYCYVNQDPCPTTGSSNSSASLRQWVKDVSGNKTTYTYDHLNRLTEARTTNGSGGQVADYQYAYDRAGNMTSQTANGATTTYAHNAANETTSITSGGATTTYTYDGDGNLTGSSAGLAITYNAKNQTTKVVQGSTTSTDSYSGPDQAERVAQNDETYTNGPLGVTSQADSGGTTYYVRDNRGRLVGETLPGGARNYYLFDGLGSVVGLTDSTGAVADSFAYDPYGNVTSKTVPVNDPWRYAGATTTAAPATPSSACATMIPATAGAGRSRTRWRAALPIRLPWIAPPTPTTIR